ncbi:uncharacterized protein PG998_011286 [Apiospora kogelbergensis]|uniref:uncharacterized protein n=1 Tax=Apiospora kogelbergensis TaxID=1337665 RepID=UPI00312E2A08
MAGFVQRIRERASVSRDPCPAADGTVFGGTVDFKVACGVDMPKSDLAQVTANNFTHCMDICISWHPKCLGFAFDALGNSGNPNNCWPKKALAPAVTQDFILDSAVATNLPTAADDCSKLGSVYSAEGSTGNPFLVRCGQYYAPGSLLEVQAASMGNCIDKCVQYNKDHPTKCVAVAYDSTQNYGYLNCYFKQSVDASGMAPNPAYKFDMAIAVTRPTSSGAAPSSPTSTGSIANLTASPTTPQPADTSAASSQTTQLPPGSYVPSWVVGAILGPTLALVLVGLIYFYSWQKKQRIKADQPRPSFKLLGMSSKSSTSASSSAASTAAASSRNHDVMTASPCPSPAPGSEMRELEAQHTRPGELEAYTPPTFGLAPPDNASKWKTLGTRSQQ